MKRILLYSWDDKSKTSPVGEARVISEQSLTRNGKERVYLWTDGNEANITIYPQYGTAYVEHEERLQRQRSSKIYLYDLVENA